jgi:hypothetical protein
MVTCQSCSSANQDEAKFCINCGAPLTNESIQTPNPQSPPPASNLQASNDNQPYQAVPQRPAKDRSIALILEVLPGLFGFLGFGWIYSGNTSTGIIWLIGFLIWTVVATIISIFTGGIGAICWLPISIALIAVSAVSLNKYTHNHPELFGP